MKEARTWRAVLFGDLGILILLGLVRFVPLLLTNGQTGWHRDELDTLDSARYLDWGYVSYPPLAPFVARVALTLFGPSLVGVHLFSTLAQALAVVLAGLMARELGGRRFAQVVAAVAVVIALPIAPINSQLWDAASDINGELKEMVGWPELVETVAGIYVALPAADKAQAGILTGNYGEAGAIDLYGPAYGLPGAISGVNSYWLRGYGDPPPGVLIVLGFDISQANRVFESCQSAGYITNRYDVLNEETRDHAIILLCRGPREPWSELWKRLQSFG